MMTIILAISAIAGLFYLFATIDAKRRAHKIEATFKGRPPLELTQFYESYFKLKGIPREVAEGVRTTLEQQLSADLSRLRDSDDFSKNLSFFWDFDSMADVEIVCALEEKFGIKITNDEAEKAHTVADIVDLVHRKLLGASHPP